MEFAGSEETAVVVAQQPFLPKAFAVGLVLPLLTLLRLAKPLARAVCHPWSPSLRGGWNI
jgi:hypothetical protein